PHADPREGVRITGDGEDGFDFGNVITDSCDRINSGFSGEAEFAEGLKRPPELHVVEPGGEAKNDAGLFQVVKSTFDRRSGEADLFSDIAESPSGVEAEKVEDRIVCLVEINLTGHATN